MTEKTDDKPAADKPAQTEEQPDLLDVTSKAYESMDEEGNLKPEKPGDEKDDEEGAGSGEAGEGDGEAGEGEGAAAGGAGAGKPGEGDGIGADADKDAKAAADKEGKPGEGKKAEDDELELTDEERAAMPERTRKRFEKLTTTYKETTKNLQRAQHERDTYRQNYEQVSGILAESRASPQQLGQLFDITADLNSGTLEKGREGVHKAYSMVQEWAKYYGVKLPQHDVLADYPDLQQQIDSGEITQEVAEQTATLRNANKGQEMFQNTRSQQEAGVQQLRTSARNAAQKVTALGQKWAKEDPDYAMKQPMMEQYMQQLTAAVAQGGLDPSVVPDLIEDRYNTITATMQATAAGRPGTAPKKPQKDEPSPMRQTASRSSAVSTKHENVEDAVADAYRRM